jgi:hypothetical protein
MRPAPSWPWPGAACDMTAASSGAGGARCRRQGPEPRGKMGRAACERVRARLSEQMRVLEWEGGELRCG